MPRQCVAGRWTRLRSNGRRIRHWLTASLSNAQRLLLIAEADDGPVGVLRYDLRGLRAEVSIYLFEGRFGLGWGRALLARGEAFVEASIGQQLTRSSRSGVACQPAVAEGVC